MDALGEQIGGEEQRLAAADAEYRAVVSRLLEAVAGHSGEELPDAGDQFEFGHGTKIVQAECKSKLVCILPRRSLSKRRLVLRKVCKPGAEPNLFGILPRRRLSKRRLVLRRAYKAGAEATCDLQN